MMKSYVLQSIRFNQKTLAGLVEDMSPADFTAMPKGERGLVLNAAAWQLPHIAMSLSGAVQFLTGKATVSADWQRRFGTGSTPSTNAADYPSKDECLAALNTSFDALVAAVEQANDEQLTAKTPHEMLRTIAPAIGDAVVFLGVSHIAMHIGQLQSLRRCLGFAPRF
ncbi:MAG: DinB family protein [Phycisphaeraceae bacterium]|nr:DinB family protein [Phycisphaeraceae bacterium]